ncbi:MAG: DUF2309 domain-containing protein [Fuerstiella sp.]
MSVSPTRFVAPLHSATVSESESVTPLSDGTREFSAPDADYLSFDADVREAIQDVEDAIAPVWPLRDYVAVNPFLGLSDRPFLNARRLLRSVSDVEMLMPVAHYRSEFHRGAFRQSDVETAVAEMAEQHSTFRVTRDDVLKTLHEPAPADDNTTADNPMRRLRTIAEVADKSGKSEWTEVIREEIGRHCAAHYDEGQALWSEPWKHLPLYQAWRSAARLDRRMHVIGLRSFHRFVDALPHTPEATIAMVLRRLQVPEELWEPFLLCQAHSIPGWSAWAKYQDAQAAEADHQNFAGLLAIRLAYDAALAEYTGLNVNWRLLAKTWNAGGRPAHVRSESDALVRFALLRASELAYERKLLSSLDAAPTTEQLTTGDAPASSQPQHRSLAQMVFCIDVRSERYRRKLEDTLPEIQTFGFAGFFGVPMAYRSMDDEEARPHVPALLSPGFTVTESQRKVSGQELLRANRNRRFRRSLQKVWKQFQASAIGCFAFVETMGIASAWKLISESYRRPAASPGIDGLTPHARPKPGPDLNHPDQRLPPADVQIDMAESMLRGIGIVENFARLVVFCGHASTTRNNPLQAGLDCGACCGHSGEPNARFAAALLNRPQVRSALRERGIHVPDETCFVAAVHDTTSDHVTFFDVDLLTSAQQADVSQLAAHTEDATRTCRLERLPELAASSVQDVLKRAADWSEVRPEWGLSGNAAFIAAPRSVTRRADLAGRTFLHSYDFTKDPSFSVLEQIMTAPMVVAHWINMQYYASSVDNHHYGSGTKTIHNVVGGFGIFSGNGGDLTTGLPWQSIHNGTELQHKPLRLLSVIAAPRNAVADIIRRHKCVEDLLVNDWLQLVVLDNGEWYRFSADQRWSPVNGSHQNLTPLMSGSPE